MAIPTRGGGHFNGPIKNKVKRDGARAWYADLNVGEEPDLCIYSNDFLVAQDYAAADWVITTTEAGTGNATEALAADERCGALVITNDDANDDVDSLQSTEEAWSLTAGKQLWMNMRLKVLDPANADMLVGLAITDTTPRDATDKIGFMLAAGSAALSCVSTKDSTSTTSSSIATLVADTYVKLAFHYDGVSKVEWFVNGAKVATHSSNLPDNENLAITLNIQNGAAAANALTVDNIYIAQER